MSWWWLFQSSLKVSPGRGQFNQVEDLFGNDSYSICVMFELGDKFFPSSCQVKRFMPVHFFELASDVHKISKGCTRPTHFLSESEYNNVAFSHKMGRENRTAI